LNFLLHLSHLPSEVLENSESFIEFLYVKIPLQFSGSGDPCKKIVISLLFIIKVSKCVFSVNFNEGEDNRDTCSDSSVFSELYPSLSVYLILKYKHSCLHKCPLIFYLPFAFRLFVNQTIDIQDSCGFSQSTNLLVE
jgi:hypothetical protein